jgi:hypothetical protein
LRHLKPKNNKSKMKKLFTLVAVAGMFAFTACGPSADEKAAMEKAKQYSIAAMEQAKMDSLNAAQEAQKAMEQARQDSIDAAGKAQADSIAKAEEAAKKKKK